MGQSGGRDRVGCPGLVPCILIGLALTFSWCPLLAGPEPPAQENLTDSVSQVSAPDFSAVEAAALRRLRNDRLESDDWTFRPTVLVRRGTSQGSGTIIASVEGETLVATAAHVIRGDAPVTVELHRYNVGAERQRNDKGLWPRLVVAEPVAADPSADVAVLRIRNLIALPYTARLQPLNEEPASKSGLTSVGIDLGSKLSSWDTKLMEILWFELNDSGSDRPFLVTNRIPEHGRSGGGLFDARGRLVGICIGHAELFKGRRMGIFSSIENLRQLLDSHKLSALLARSDARRGRLARILPSQREPLYHPSRPEVTSTEASRTDPSVEASEDGKTSD